MIEVKISEILNLKANLFRAKKIKKPQNKLFEASLIF
jgi:hypothetical protein